MVHQYIRILLTKEFQSAHLQKAVVGHHIEASSQRDNIYICERFPYLRMAANCYLPIEMRLEILEKLSLHELVVNSSKTCHQWRDDIAQHILAPKILALAEVNEKFKMDIKEKGWAEEANNTTELLMSLYNKYEYFTSKFLFC